MTRYECECGESIEIRGAVCGPVTCFACFSAMRPVPTGRIIEASTLSFPAFSREDVEMDRLMREVPGR